MYIKTQSVTNNFQNLAWSNDKELQRHFLVSRRVEQSRSVEIKFQPHSEGEKFFLLFIHMLTNVLCQFDKPMSPETYMMNMMPSGSQPLSECFFHVEIEIIWPDSETSSLAFPNCVQLLILSLHQLYVDFPEYSPLTS